MNKLEFVRVGSCPTCLGDDSVRVEVARAYGHRLEYRACSACGLVRMDPRPTAEAIGQFYQTFYMGKGRDVEFARTKQREFAYFMVSAIALHLRLDRVRTVLDVGCGYGETLVMIAKALSNYGDVSLYGIEPSEEARLLAAQVCELVGYSHDDLLKSERQYDLIVLSHVLEHMADPVATLKLLKLKLTPDGAIALEVPNYFCHPSTDIVHNYLFTPDSLTSAIAAAGLDLVALHCSDHASSSKPAYLTAVVRAGQGGAILRTAPSGVLQARRAAVRKWPGFTSPTGPRQFAKRLLRFTHLG